MAATWKDRKLAVIDAVILFRRFLEEGGPITGTTAKDIEDQERSLMARAVNTLWEMESERWSLGKPELYVEGWAVEDITIRQEASLVRDAFKLLNQGRGI